jgi:hypothetical protein
MITIPVLVCLSLKKNLETKKILNCGKPVGQNARTRRSRAEHFDKVEPASPVN